MDFACVYRRCGGLSPNLWDLGPGLQTRPRANHPVPAESPAIIVNMGASPLGLNTGFVVGSPAIVLGCSGETRSCSTAGRACGRATLLSGRR